jgi:hypothetical protein
MKPPSSEVSPCDDPRSLPENRASPRCGSHVRARLSTVTSVFAAGWPPSVTVFRRSRRARLLGACARVRLSTFAFTSTFGSCRRPFLRTSLGALLACPQPFAPCGAPGRVHLLVVRIRVRLSTLTAVSTPSAHSPRAREFVSRYDGVDCDPLSRTAASHRSRQHARAHLATITFALPYHRAFALVSAHLGRDVRHPEA